MTQCLTHHILQYLPQSYKQPKTYLRHGLTQGQDFNFRWEKVTLLDTMFDTANTTVHTTIIQPAQNLFTTLFDTRPGF